MTTRRRVFAGYAGWGAGQLENELERDDWILEPALERRRVHRGARRALGGRAAPQGRHLRARRAHARGPVASTRRPRTRGRARSCTAAGRLLDAARELAHARLRPRRAPRRDAAAMKLIERTRSTTPCSSTSCSCSKSARSHRSKSPLLGEQRLPVALLAARRVALERVDDLRERRLQRVALVARVPDSATPPPGRSTRWISRSASSASNQWNAWPDRHGVDGRVRERDALGRAGERLRRRAPAARARPHLAHRLDRDHVRAARHEQPRQLARAGGEVEHGAPGPQRELLDDPRDRRGRIVGPAALVDVGGGEASRRRMQVRHGSTGRGR